MLRLTKTPLNLDISIHVYSRSSPSRVLRRKYDKGSMDAGKKARCLKTCLKGHKEYVRGV